MVHIVTHTACAGALTGSLNRCSARPGHATSHIGGFNAVSRLRLFILLPFSVLVLPASVYGPSVDPNSLLFPFVKFRPYPNCASKPPVIRLSLLSRSPSPNPNPTPSTLHASSLHSLSLPFRPFTFASVPPIILSLITQVNALALIGYSR